MLRVPAQPHLAQDPDPRAAIGDRLADQPAQALHELVRFVCILALALAAWREMNDRGIHMIDLTSGPARRGYKLTLRPPSTAIT